MRLRNLLGLPFGQRRGGAGLALAGRHGTVRHGRGGATRRQYVGRRQFAAAFPLKRSVNCSDEACGVARGGEAWPVHEVQT